MLSILSSIIGFERLDNAFYQEYDVLFFDMRKFWRWFFPPSFFFFFFNRVLDGMDQYNFWWLINGWNNEMSNYQLLDYFSSS